MGLCKCEKKKVTNQFCFEHRVNVCEHCLVSQHNKCIVKSYRLWLNDSDYNPVCQLCQKELLADECIRLVCYDVFHVMCLDGWASRHPTNTAPDGYRCPICTEPIFPAHNNASPVAQALRTLLTTFKWAKHGLDLPMLGDEDMNNSKQTKSSLVPQVAPQLHANHIAKEPEVKPIKYQPESSSLQNSVTMEGGGSKGFSRKPSSSTSLPHAPTSSSKLFIPNLEDDSGDKKYKRRSALDWLNRWMRTFQRPSSRHHQSVLGNRRLMMALLAVVAMGTVVMLMSIIGRDKEGYSDPLLDPLNNPNIHVQED